MKRTGTAGESTEEGRSLHDDRIDEQLFHKSDGIPPLSARSFKAEDVSYISD